MSYEKVIGFGINPDKPKGPVGVLTSREFDYFDRMGVEPIFLDLKKWMPESNREPEQKIFFKSAKGFNEARNIITNARNAFLIPGQIYEDKNPLTSVLIDNGFLDAHHYTLRYRFEMDPETGMRTQGDYNEKSGMKNSDIIGGCIDRFERELEQRPGETLEAAYDAFRGKYRRLKDPAFCDQIAFSSLMVGGGYQAARNELGIAFKHPTDDVMFVFEACEDFWEANTQDMSQVLARFYEWEIECKQVWGRPPAHIKPGESFKHYVYSTMTMFRDFMQLHVPHSSINMKSKAEITKEHLENHLGFEKVNVRELGLTGAFRDAAKIHGEQISAFVYAALMSDTLANTLEASQKSIHNNGARLFKEKERFNEMATKPSLDSIGYGTYDIPYQVQDRAFRQQNRRGGLVLHA